MTEQEQKDLLVMTNTARDQDVLDTWFSSGLWPFSVLDYQIGNP
jgi:valyl-tRNA synthetase